MCVKSYSTWLFHPDFLHLAKCSHLQWAPDFPTFQMILKKKKIIAWYSVVYIFYILLVSCSHPWTLELMPCKLLRCAWEFRCLSNILMPLLLDIYPAVGLLGSMGVLFLILYRTFILYFVFPLIACEDSLAHHWSTCHLSLPGNGWSEVIAQCSCGLCFLLVFVDRPLAGCACLLRNVGVHSDLLLILKSVYFRNDGSYWVLTHSGYF